MGGSAVAGGGAFGSSGGSCFWWGGRLLAWGRDGFYRVVDVIDLALHLLFSELVLVAFILEHFFQSFHIFWSVFRGKGLCRGSGSGSGFCGGEYRFFFGCYFVSRRN